MTALSTRLCAADALRSLALAHPADTNLDGDVVRYVRSAALVAEIATLLAAYQVRGAVTDRAGVTSEVVRQVGKTALRNWWLAHCQQLHDEHLDEVRSALVACGVSDAPGATP